MSLEFRYFTLPKILVGLVIILAVVLGLAVGGFQPLASTLHLRTTVPYYITLTRTMTLFVTNTTTIIVNHTLTVTTTTTSLIILTRTYTTTVTNTTTVRSVIIQPVTTTTTVTVNYTTTVVSTITLTPPPPGTGGSIVPGINITKAEYDPEYFIEAFKNYTSLLAPYFSILGLRPITQFACYATGFKLANGSSGVIIVLVGNTSSIVSIGGFWPLPNGTEWSAWAWVVLGVNTTGALESAFYERVFGLPAYTIGNVTIAGGVYGKGFTPLFPYNMPNGTYIAWLVNFNESSIIYPCILEVVNAKSWDVLANYTFLGGQYWAWVRSMAYFGKPAPCFEPFEWTIGWQLARLNITMPIGPAWQYYCGPNGIWRGLKP